MMKENKTHYLLVLMMFFVSSCGTISQLATSKHEPYSSVQKLSLQKQIKTKNSIIVPIDLSESSFRFNSGLAIRKIKTTTKNDSISFYIVSCLAGGNLSLGGQPSINVDRPKYQQYTVYYLDPDNTKHEIGKIEITE